MASSPVQLACISFLRRAAPLAIVFLIAQTALRLVLLVLVHTGIIDSPIDILRTFACGLWFDLVALSIGLLPVTVYWVLTPKSLRGSKLDAAIIYSGFATFLFIIGFTVIAEILFWLEFGTRFNFIAVDYLFYTQEVLGNIWESYPVVTLLTAVIVVSVAITYILRKTVKPFADGVLLRSRLAVGAVVLIAASAMVAVTDRSWSQQSANVYANELALDGYYAFVDAFFHNELSYGRFYVTADRRRVDLHIRELLANGHAKFTSDRPPDLTHEVVANGRFSRKNVIVVMMESMSAEFMAHFGNKQGITPNLDRIADGGILFTNLLATGTRTVRGLEAITLSVPPTPGQSIVRRPGNGNLFSLGSVLRDFGYDTAFVYGGYGLFDNMNSFYKANDYRLVDRTSMAADEISFANVWGVCDEDIFNRVVREADAAYAAGRPFLQQVMTVSNHRPYTYPDGKIDIAPGSGREGGVKYADYAVGRFIELAKSKPWFADTLFVFVADHTASSAGKIELDPLKFHIPAIFYAPAFVPPGTVDHLTSQIDIAPTILGVLNASYRSRFVGEDQIRGPRVARAFIANFEKLGFIRGNRIAVLGPKREVKGYVDGKAVERGDVDEALLFDAITYYQFSSDWKDRFRRIDSTIPVMSN